MIPVRLTLLLIGAILLVLLVLGNPQPVVLSFLFWRGSFALYEVILGGTLLGILFTIIYTGHVRYILRIKQDRINRR